MIEFVYDTFLDDRAQPFSIENKSGVGVGISLNGHIELEIVPMPIVIGTLSKNLFIFFGRPVWVIESMGGIEMLDTG
jgi:hypothetical protein